MSIESKDAVLEVLGLRTWFFTDEGVARAVDDVTYRIPRGKTLGLVGESGCGKSVTSLSILRLVPTPPGKTISGQILLEGRNLLEISEEEMRSLRGNEISMIFQEPMTALNPVYTIGDQIIESVRLHMGLSKAAARARAIEMLAKVGIPSPASRVDEYPHQLSGGMRQRAMIAMALSCNPKLLIADEPSTALDVTIQAQILDLMRELQKDNGMSVLLITHDLGVVAEMADEVCVMYAGKVVESGDVRTIFKRHRHPYTEGLFHSLPGLETDGARLQAIEGNVPTPYEFPSGCRFRDRCPLAEARCAEAEPPLVEVEAGHELACFVRTEARTEARA
ncbi:MAG: peptide ABC transporter ATP-binding protein [Planctomycetota bacterium]|nr:MAG: peptide ABC transporter ATP-binding protein [Planctomycetota bacterium]